MYAWLVWLKQHCIGMSGTVRGRIPSAVFIVFPACSSVIQRYPALSSVIQRYSTLSSVIQCYPVDSGFAVNLEQIGRWMEWKHGLAPVLLQTTIPSCHEEMQLQISNRIPNTAIQSIISEYNRFKWQNVTLFLKGFHNLLFKVPQLGAKYFYFISWACWYDEKNYLVLY